MIDALRSAVEALILQVMGPIDTWACYLGTVVKQTGNLLDVKLDDPRYGPGLSKIPYRTGIPGASAVVPAGTRVAVGFEQGRRDLPCIKAWVDGTPISVTIETSDAVTIKATNQATIDAAKIELGAGALKGVARFGDAVQAGPYAGTITSASGSVTAQD